MKAMSESGPLANESVESLIEKVNKALQTSADMSPQETVEYDAKYGYEPDIKE